MRSLVQLLGVAVLFVIEGSVLVLPAVAGDADAFAKGTGDDRGLHTFDQFWSVEGANLAWAYTNRGTAYRAQGEPDRAIADYQKAIWLNPKFADAYNGRGNA